MPTDDAGKPPPKRRKAARGKATPIAHDVNPPAIHAEHKRLDSMTRGRVKALEDDKKRLIDDNKQLRMRVDELGPENARLRVSLDYLQENNVLATIFVVVGGGGLSFASFSGNAAPFVAFGSVGLLIAGVVIMIWESARSRRKP